VVALNALVGHAENRVARGGVDTLYPACRSLPSTFLNDHHHRKSKKKPILCGFIRLLVAYL
jgi:hypothetical protein